MRNYENAKMRTCENAKMRKCEHAKIRKMRNMPKHEKCKTAKHANNANKSASNVKHANCPKMQNTHPQYTPQKKLSVMNVQLINKMRNA